MSHVRWVWTTVTVLVAWLPATMTSSAELASAPMNVYFGNLGTCPDSAGAIDGPRHVYDRARTVWDLDFLAITERTESSALASAAARVNAAFAGRFVALYGHQYANSSVGRLADVFEVGNLTEGTVPNSETLQLVSPACDSTNTSRGRIAAQMYLQYLNAGFRLAPSTGLDPYMSARVPAAQPRTAVLARSLSRVDILEGIHHRRVYVTEDRNLKVSFTINGRPMGAVMALPPGTPLRIEFRFSDADEPAASYHVSLRHDVVGGAVEADEEVSATDFRGDGTVVFAQLRRGPGEEYFLAQITQGDGADADVVWTAPIWLVATEAAEGASRTPGMIRDAPIR